jgi:hypothetical protein
MDVRADHHVDVLGAEPGPRQIAKEIGLQVAEDLQVGTILVVPCPGIEQDALCAGIQHPALQESKELAACRVVVFRRKFLGMGVPPLWREPGKQLGRRREGSAPFLDAMNLHGSEVEAVHQASGLCWVRSCQI